MDLSSDFLPFSGTVSILNFHEEDKSGVEVGGPSNISHSNVSPISLLV